MNVTIIRATNRKNSSTYNAARYLISKLTDIDEVYEFILPKDMPHICRGVMLAFTATKINAADMSI